MSDPVVCACGAPSEVIETRKSQHSLRRRRRCQRCGLRWTTYEVRTGMAVLVGRPVVPRPLRREPVRVVAVRSAAPAAEARP
jgi:transcriptional regulator NrdR family protein